MGISEEVLTHYDGGREEARLRRGGGLLELLRTQDVLRRFLPEPPAEVLDVGGGAGVHAEWLAADGYQVHLVDPVALHVRQAGAIPGVHATLGDARTLTAPDESYDAVLLCGPLYHLPDAGDRLLAWQEAARVVRPGGLVAAATIGRYASLFDGLRKTLPLDPRFREMVAHALETGEHRPPPNTPWFTTAYFHRPDEPAHEAREAGLDVLTTVTVEGTAWMLAEDDLDASLRDPVRREYLLWALRHVEADPAVLGAASHLLTLALKELPEER